MGSSSRMDSHSVILEVYDLFVQNLLSAGRYLEAFEKHDTRMEGWFHGQLVTSLSIGPRREWRLMEVGKKVDETGQLPDIYIEAAQERISIEIKSMIIGRRSLMQYFRKSFGRDLKKLVASRCPMGLITVAFPITDGGKWRELADSVHREYGTSPLVERDVMYANNRRARVTLWMKEMG